MFPISEIAKVAECSFSPVPDNTVPKLLCFRFQMSELQNVASLLSHLGDWFKAKDGTVATIGAGIAQWLERRTRD